MLSRGEEKKAHEKGVTTERFSKTRRVVMEGTWKLLSVSKFVSDNRRWETECCKYAGYLRYESLQSRVSVFFAVHGNTSQLTMLAKRTFHSVCFARVSSCSP